MQQSADTDKPDSTPLKAYVVGGAVRDELLGRAVQDHDWVVVGATPEQMLALGYHPVGKDFPVFLHPQSHEEYALARTERKTAAGYHGFDVYAAPDVTLEQDLARRDLTINAMARGPDGGLIDPYGGRRDLEQRWLRHVSPAFAEDPVRVLRLARFAARYHRLGFRVADDTLTLMRRMVAAGEVDALVPERVWAETQRALMEADPQRFFEVLRECGALARLFPEVDRLYGIPQPPHYHPEIDTGVHTMLALAQSVRLQADAPVRFAVLVHDLGKAVTPPDQWPSHRGHEQRGVPLVRALCTRLKVPKAYRDLALLVTEFHLLCHRAGELRPPTLLALLERCDAFRRAQRFDQFLLACECDARGRSGLSQQAYPQAGWLQRLRTAAAAIDARALAAQGLQGPAMAEAVHQARLDAIRERLNSRD